MSSPNITSVLKETRTFPPPEAFAKAAFINAAERQRLYDWAEKDPDGFWAECAKSLQWDAPFTSVLDWSNAPHANWFVGGTLNVSANCLDRHIANGQGNKAAIIWEGEPGDSRTLTYRQLHREVCRFANGLKSLGVVKGDRVTIYLPMVPEAAIAMLACARIGAVHSVVFGGFSAEAVADRNNDAMSKLVITADGGWRRGKVVPLEAERGRGLREVADDRKGHCPEPLWHGHGHEAGPGRLVARRDVGGQCRLPGRAFRQRTPALPALHLRQHGQAEGRVAHFGRVLARRLAHAQVGLRRPRGRRLLVHGRRRLGDGSLATSFTARCANGATVLMYEGAPNQPREDRFWEIVEKYRVTILYTAPTAIRAFIKWGDQWPKGHDLSSLRLLGSVGEPINPEAWMWYHEVIGGGRCPIVDTWWQTETGAIMISPLPGAVGTKPGCATLPLPGIAVEVVDKQGNRVPDNEGGFLVVKRPWPSMMRTIYGDDARFVSTYWSHYPGIYFTADGARRDADGYIWVMGRVDDVLNVSGHRLSTMEVESALVQHPKVAEAAVVGRPDDLKGESICCFVTLKQGQTPSDALKAELKAHVAKEIGALARPDDIRFTETLPKTRSGKIMRRLLRDVAAGRDLKGDTTTLEDIGALAKLREDEE